MKLLMSFLLMVSAHCTFAQELPVTNARSGVPLTITIFSESISLPTFRKMQKGGIGLRIGTELYYRNRPGSQTLQTINVGYYYHPNVQSGLFVNSEFGYRKYFGPVYVDATIGGGALLLRTAAPAYIRDETTLTYRKDSPYQVKFMPTVGMGAGYRFRSQTAVFARYELFGEMPFSQILLPHQSVQVGTRFLLH